MTDESLLDLLNDKKLNCLTVVRMGRQDLIDGNKDSCFARLKVDADKIRSLNPQLYRCVMEYKPTR